MAMSPPWVSGAWASGAWDEDAWGLAPPGTGVVWEEGSWAGGTWAAGTWLDVPKIYATYGSYSVNGQVVNLEADLILPANQGSYSLSGQDVTFSATITFTAETGSYSLSGQDAHLTSSLYRIISVNGDNEVETNEVGIAINGEGLENTNIVELQYGSDFAWGIGVWASGVWESGSWAGDGTALTSISLTNIFASENLVTADMPDIVSSPIPFSDINHTNHRIYASDETSESFVRVEVLPPSGYVVLPVQPASANTTAGQSIFAGMSINTNSQVLLPTEVDGRTATWETVGGNATGRLTLSSVLDNPVPVSIPFWDNTNGWDTIETNIVDQSDLNRVLEADTGNYSLSGQNTELVRSRLFNAETGSYVVTGVATGLYRGFQLPVDNLSISTAIDSTLVSDGVLITSVWGVGPNVIQSRSRFRITGIGFGNNPSTMQVILANSSGAFECTIVSISNELIVANVPPEALALTQPVTLYVGDFLKDSNGQVIYDNTYSPLSTSDSIGYDSHPNVTVIQFVSANLLIGTSLDTVSLIQHNILNNDNLNIEISLSDSLVRAGYIYPSDITVGTSITEPTLLQHHVLNTDDIEISVSLTEPDVEQNITIQSADLRINTVLTQVSLIQHHELLVNDLTVNTAFTSSLIKQHNQLATDDLTVDTSITSPSLVQIRRIDSSDLSISVSFESPILNQHSSLSVDNMTVTITLDDSTVTRTYSLSTDDLNVGVSFTSPTLIQHGSLNNNNLFVATKIASPTLTQHNILDVNDLNVNVSLSSTRMGSELEAVTIKQVLVFPAIDGEILINP